MDLLIAGWLILYGVFGIFKPDIPGWIVPLAALIVGVLVALSGTGVLRRS